VAFSAGLGIWCWLVVRQWAWRWVWPGLEEETLNTIVVDAVKQVDVQDVSAAGNGDVWAAGSRRGYKRSDRGNAERLIVAHGQDLRFCPGLGWLWWDGRRWSRDTNGEAMRRLKQTVRSLFDEIKELADPEQWRAWYEFALRSEGASGLKAALKVAETEAGLVAAAEQLDCDPWLLVVENGTLDLRSGELGVHSRVDLNTKLSRVRYQPGVGSEVWEGFLDRVTGGDQELCRFLQRAVGYSLTGVTREEKLFFAHGPAASGKSTFLEAIRGLLGDYATSTDFESFIKKGGGSVRNDIARLAGTRLVVGVEVDDGRELANGLIKQLTGGDTVMARFLYQEFFEYVPRFKLWLAANDRPLVPATDEGMWRRIIQIPFDHTIPESERDPSVKERLRYDPYERSAILNWALEGCQAWQQTGLVIPQRVRNATAEYRLENDPVGDFLADHCILEPHAATPRDAIRTAYDRWSVAGGQTRLSDKQLAAGLKRHGITEGAKVGQKRAWHGVTLTTPTTEATPSPF
jgi:putative DNA primase/helicase